MFVSAGFAKKSKVCVRSVQHWSSKVHLDGFAVQLGSRDPDCLSSLLPEISLSYTHARLPDFNRHSCTGPSLELPLIKLLDGSSMHSGGPFTLDSLHQGHSPRTARPSPH